MCCWRPWPAWPAGRPRPASDHSARTRSGWRTGSTARPGAGGANLRLALFGSDGRLLVQSDGKANGDKRAEIVQYLNAGSYFVSVSGREFSLLQALLDRIQF